MYLSGNIKEYKHDDVMCVKNYNLCISVFRYIELVRGLLCKHSWLSIGCQPDCITVPGANRPITAKRCV